MRTETIISRTKGKITKRKANIKKLARDYANMTTKDVVKEKSILKRLKEEKKKKNELEHLVKRMNNRKKTMPTMAWKKSKSHVENILENLK